MVEAHTAQPAINQLCPRAIYCEGDERSLLESEEANQWQLQHPSGSSKESIEGGGLGREGEGSSTLADRTTSQDHSRPFIKQLIRSDLEKLHDADQEFCKQGDEAASAIPISAEKRAPIQIQAAQETSRKRRTDAPKRLGNNTASHYWDPGFQTKATILW